MRTLLLVITASCLAAQAKLPADIDPQSFSRFPFVHRDQLSGEALKAFDIIAPPVDGKPRETPPMGPVATSMYSLRVAVPMYQLNMNLRTTGLGEGLFHLCALLGARAYDDNYEWSSHEGGARKAGISDKGIDAVRYHRALDGVPEKEALTIRFGRALLDDHKVSSELYAEVVKTFGREGMYEMAAVIGDYVMGAIMLRAVDQHYPNPTPELPALAK